MSAPHYVETAALELITSRPGRNLRAGEAAAQLLAVNPRWRFDLRKLSKLVERVYAERAERGEILAVVTTRGGAYQARLRDRRPVAA